MIVGIADTHATIWYLFSIPRLGNAASAFIEGAIQKGDRIGVSAISVVDSRWRRKRSRICGPAEKRSGTACHSRLDETEAPPAYNCYRFTWSSIPFEFRPEARYQLRVLFAGACNVHRIPFTIKLFEGKSPLGLSAIRASGVASGLCHGSGTSGRQRSHSHVRDRLAGGAAVCGCSRHAGPPRAHMPEFS